MTRNKIKLIPGLGLGIVAITSCATPALGSSHGQPSSRPAAIAAHHPSPSLPATSRHREPTPRASAVAARAGHHRTFHSWWRRAGRSQYAKVAADLWKVIITDVMKDQDATFTTDLRNLAADTGTALGNPPPVGTAEYVAAMGDFHSAGEIGLRSGSYARAYVLLRAGLTQMSAFNATTGLKGQHR
ncbi:MAG TPA: hypothetical protein VIX86_08045 [Streptosporangiaceae bacterium]